MSTVNDAPAMPATAEPGLSRAEVETRMESGQSNRVKDSTSRSLLEIIRANVFTLFNGIILAAMVLVLITGSWRDAVFGFVIIINTGIGIVTELRAKRTLDRLSILVASDFLVRRDGRDVEVPHNQIVLDDVMWIRSGEQVPADAQVLESWGLELDESMLTGESRTVRKDEGDQIYSGSTAVSGMALVRVNAVGEHSYAATLTAQAKVYKKTVSDLNKGINTILKFMNKMLLEEVVPILPLDQEDCKKFAAAVQDRFNNPFVNHELMSISLNSTAKWRARNMPSLLEYVEKNGKLPACLAMGLAAYIAFYSNDIQELTDAGLVCKRPKGNTYTVNDDRWVLEFYNDHKDDDIPTLVHAVMTNEQMWGQDLTKVLDFEEVTVKNLTMIREKGALAAYASCL